MVRAVVQEFCFFSDVAWHPCVQLRLFVYVNIEFYLINLLPI